MFFHHLFALLNQAFHPFAFLPFKRFVQCIHYLIEARDLAFGFFKMRLECLAKLFCLGGCGHFRKRLQKLLLGVVNIGKFLEKELPQVCVHRVGARGFS